ncbi:MAG TPA: ComEC/Rec2 family competence protein, partial [Candidatus Sumerlaeota bacterium]|nr:ComEC/Rec2 family competence protein [Candidatus Sumerlaeota bacterium]
MKRPAFIVLLLLLAGRILGMNIAAPAWLALSATVLLLIAHGSLFLARKKNLTSATSGCLLLAAVFFLGFHQQRLIVEADNLASLIVEKLPAQPAPEVAATIAAEPDYRSDSVTLLVKNPSISWQGKTISLKSRALVYLYNEAAEEIRKNVSMRGDKIHLRSRIAQSSALSNPTLPDYQKRLRQRGIHLIFRINTSDDISIAPPQSGRSVINKSLHAVAGFHKDIATIFDSVLSPANSALLKGLAMGRTEDILPADKDAFQQTGLVHLFSVSGLHAGVIAALVFFLLRLAYLNIRIAAILTIIFIWIFAIFVGFQSPVVRSAIMISMLLASYWLPGLKRPLDGISLLSFAAFWTLILNPRALSQVDFQLSYICVAGMVILLPVFKDNFFLNLEFASSEQKALRAKINRRILFPLFMVLSIQLAILPLLAHYFHRISLASFMANPIAIPFAFLCLALAAAMVLAGYLFPLMLPLLGVVA